MSTIDARVQTLKMRKLGGQTEDVVPEATDEDSPAGREADRAAGTSAAVNPDPELDSNHWLYPEGSRSITPPGGRSGEITAYGETYLQVDFFDRSRGIFTKSSSHVAWLGTSPLNADKVVHADRWRVEAYPGPVAFGVNRPPGSVTSPAELQWQTEAEDDWISQHSWDEVAFTVRGALLQSRFTVAGTFQFGSTFFVVTGTDAAAT